MIGFEVSKKKIYTSIVLLVLLQSGLWYGGLADLIPTVLLNQWNKISCIFMVVLIVLCIAKKRYINIATLLLILYKVFLLYSTFCNGRSIDMIDFCRFMCIVLAIEYFEDDIPELISALMIIFEVMIYYNFLTLSTGPDLYGAYYTALGYDNAASPYMVMAYLVAVCYGLEKKKYIRTCAMILVIHITLLITMVGSGLVAIGVIDLMLLVYSIKHFRISLFKTYCIYLGITFAIVVCRVQNIFSFLIVDILGKDLTFTGRTKDWDLAFSLISNKFFIGHGIMNQETEKMILGDVYTHNAVVEQFFRGGIIAFLIFVIGIYFVSKVYNNSAMMPSRKSDCLVCVMCGFWVVSMVEIIFEGTIFYCGLALYFHVCQYWEFGGDKGWYP